MSYIGKILVVMQLVLSVCLMAFAAAVSSYQTNWKAKTESTQKLLDQANQDKQKLEQESKQAADTFNKQLKDEQDKGRELAAKVSLLTSNLTNVTEQNKRLAEENSQKTQIGIDLADDSNARQNEVKILREKLKLALEDRDKEYKAKAALEDKIFEQDTKIARLSGQNTNLMVQNKKYVDVLASRGLPTELEEYERGKTVPPKIEGKVLEARKSKEGGQMLLTVSLGENDGLTLGNELTVYRGGAKTKYLGRARVLSLQADTAVCELFQRAGLVEEGDDVSTKLN